MFFISLKGKISERKIDFFIHMIVIKSDDEKTHRELASFSIAPNYIYLLTHAIMNFHQSHETFFENDS